MEILLVDDDRFVIAALEKGIPWDTLGITKVHTAYDMKSALEILGHEDISLLLSDIDMPHGSGLDLLNTLRESGNTIPAIFLTNYADFSYAQKALELKSFHYFLKPIDYEKLTEIIREAMQLSTLEGSKQKKALSQVWADYLLHKSCDSLQVSKSLAALHHSEKIPLYQPYLLSLYPYSLAKDYSLENPLADTGKTTERLRATLEAALGGDYMKWGVLLPLREDLYQYLFLRPATAEDQLIVPEEILHLLKKEFTCPLTLQYGDTYTLSELSGLGSILKDAGRDVIYTNDQVCKLAFSVLNGVEKMSGSEKEPLTYTILTTKVSAELPILLKDGQYQEFYKRCKDCLTGLMKPSSQDLLSFQIDVVQILYAFLKEKGILANKLYRQESYQVLSQHAKYSTLYMDFFLQVLVHTASKYLEENANEQSVTSTILQYVDQHFTEDLSRETLSDLFYFDEDYITRLFKKETGLSFKNYVIEKRLSLAKDLLEHSSAPIHEIATRVGYDNYSYFTRLFKKTYQLTPIEYRNQLI